MNIVKKFFVLQNPQLRVGSKKESNDPIYGKSDECEGATKGRGDKFIFSML